MKGLCLSIGQSLKCSGTNIALTSVRHDIITQKSVNTMRGLCSCNHIKEITQSYLVLQLERKIWSPPKNDYAPKSIIEWEICPYVKYTRWNMPIMSHAPMWKENLITSEKWPRPKIHHRLRNMPLCKVHQMKYANHVLCSNVKKDVWSPSRNSHDSKSIIGWEEHALA